MKNEENLALYNQVRFVPDTAKTPIQGGRMNGKTSIEPMWRIKTLTEHFGPCGLGWYYVPVRKWTEAAGEEIAVFVDIELYVKYADGWSKPIAGTGGDMLVSRERGGLYVSDECYKKATTNALSVACKQLGIGADVYWDKDQKGKRYSSSAPVPSHPHTPEKNPSPVCPLALEERYIHSLCNELKRTGIGVNSLLRNYGRRRIDELSFEEYKDAIRKLTAKPDKAGKSDEFPAPVPDKPPDAEKPLNPGFIPPEEAPEGVPWSDKDRKDKEEKLALVQEPGQDAGQRRTGAADASGIASSLLSASLVEEGYTYCGSFGGN